MLLLRFTFPAGRYHANPWDRHVNEGEVAWPPDPWRILRALIATWHRKLKVNSRHGENVLTGLIESLAGALPEYVVPAASHYHTRHYLPQWKAGDTSLVFDAFAAVDRDDPLYLRWPDLNLPADQIELLDDLLEALGYLGRAESWVEARRVEQAPLSNCVPGDETVDRDTGELRWEVVNLFAPVTAVGYAQQRQVFLQDRRKAKKLASTLPEGLPPAISVETADLQKQGWSQPPASRRVSYLRPVDALRPTRVARKSYPPKATTARFLIIGKPLPRIEDSVRIGELVRLAVISHAGRILGEGNIPPVFSGHDLPANNRHQHAFYLPLDANGDGRLDRVLIHVPAGFDGAQRRIIEGLRRIWQREGGEWRLVLEGIGTYEVGGKLTVPSRSWRSVTPYLHPWHTKKRLTVEDQIRRECNRRNLPDVVELEAMETVEVGSGKRRPIQFHRFRKKRGLTQPDRLGSFWQLHFASPVGGPLALGFACHFGLGLFCPAETRGK
ncbi:MAG: type I-U CRISPR-associated protein Csb2 [Gammaproteobacteria bacterium]|jgi:CRISPR-associated protein Csb2|nr:type I-U CRISPR-associated protein Csb2 [Gammaproteobacteria bacterium]